MKINKKYKIKPIRNPYPVSRKNRIRFFSHSFDLETHELIPETYKVDIDLLQEAGDLNFYLNYKDNDFPNKINKYVYDVDNQINNTHNIIIDTDFDKRDKHYLYIDIKSEQFKFIDYIDIKIINKSRELGDWFKPIKQDGVINQWKQEKWGWILNSDIYVNNDNVYTIKLELNRQEFTDTYNRLFDIAIALEVNEKDYYNYGWDAEEIAKVNSLIELKFKQKSVPYYFRITKFSAISNGKSLNINNDNTYNILGTDPLSYKIAMCSNADLILKTYIMNGNKKEEFKWWNNNNYIRYIKLLTGTNINNANDWTDINGISVIPKNESITNFNNLMLSLKPFYGGNNLARMILFEFYDKNNNKLVYSFKINQTSFISNLNDSLLEIIGNLRINPFKDEQSLFNKYIQNGNIPSTELARYYNSKSSVLCCGIKISDSGHIQLLPTTTKGVKIEDKNL